MFGALSKLTSLTGPQMSALQQAVVSDQRKAYVAVLMAAAAGATKKPNFKIELEMNDLWTSLSVLKLSNPVGAAPMAGIGQALQGAFGGITKVLDDILKPLGR